MEAVRQLEEQTEFYYIKKKKVTPDRGIEPPTTRLRVVRSTD